MANRAAASKRRTVVPLPPRGLRARLSPTQVRDLSLAHNVNLDAIASGQSDEDILWQMVGGMLTWSRVAELLGLGEEEMEQQLLLAERVIERFRRTGRVIYSGPEYELAKVGVQVMDVLAETVDRVTAVVAAEWSENQIAQMAARGRQKEKTPS